MPSIRSQLFKLYFRLRNQRLALDRPVEVQRRNLDRLGSRLPLPKGAVLHRFDLAGVPAEWIDTPGIFQDRVLLYFHGGGYFVGSCASHRGFVAPIAQAARARLLMPEYRLAPEHPFPAALEDAQKAYQHLLDQGFSPERILIGGDSAGGGLALALLLSLRDGGRPLPAGAILLSPWTDLAGTGESLRTRAKRDPWLRPGGVLLTAERYARDVPLDHPLVSPLYADLHGLPPLLIHVGDDEILLDDSRRLAAKAAAAGVDVKITIWDGLWHVFHAFYLWVPEAKQAYRDIQQWVESHLPRQSTDVQESEASRRSASPGSRVSLPHRPSPRPQLQSETGGGLGD